MFYALLNKLNKLILPAYSRKNLNKLSKFDQAIIAYRLYVTKKVLK